MPKANMFTTAKVAAAPKTTKKGSTKAEVIIKGLETATAIDAVIKALTALKTTVREGIDKQMTSEFIGKGNAESFRGIEGLASASCELRCRASNRGLSDEEIVLLTEEGISIETNTTVEQCHRINPKYFSDESLLTRVAKQLEKVKDIPEDFIEVQEGKSTQIVTQNSLRQVFNKSPEKAAELLKVVATLALKPKFENDDIGYALSVVQTLLVGDDAEAHEATKNAFRASAAE